jgi:hypothetical protein
MAIVDTITNDYALWEALQKTDGYKNNFTIEGANALQAYMEELSEELGEDIEFDPIAWACEYSEFADYEDAWNRYGNQTQYIEGEELAIDDNIKLWLENNTEIIEFDGGVIVRDF